MEKIVINGGHRLVGEVTISSAKNAVVGLLVSTVLAEDVCVIENVPDISDVRAILAILSSVGADVKMLDKNTVRIDTTHISSYKINYEFTKQARATYYFMGAFISRFKKSSVSLPGGCDFGVRPIDQHIKGFEALGGKVDLDQGLVNIDVENLIGNQIYFDLVSVGATINVMLAAVKAKGMTILENAAREPHVVDVANFLNAMGADIMGAGTNVVKIRGVSKLHGSRYSVVPDMIEAGTFMVATAITGGNVLIKNVIPKHLEPITDKMRKIGVNVDEYDDCIRVWADKSKLKKCNIKTLPHPGFPTDMQPQIATLLSVAEGVSIVTEGVWDDRFRYINELRRMGANIQSDGKVAVIEGVKTLKGAPVAALDLRAGAAVMVAGLAAEGITEIGDIYHIERGYDNMIAKLQNLGADIKKINKPEKASLSEAL